jgi:hypothetical protein
MSSTTKPADCSNIPVDHHCWGTLAFKQEPDHLPAGGGFSVQVPLTVGRKVPLVPHVAIGLPV